MAEKKQPGIRSSLRHHLSNGAQILPEVCILELIDLDGQLLGVRSSMFDFVPFEYPGAICHVTSRGNEKKPIFKDDDDEVSFLSILARVNTSWNYFSTICLPFI